MRKLKQRRAVVKRWKRRGRVEWRAILTLPDGRRISRSCRDKEDARRVAATLEAGDAGVISRPKGPRKTPLRLEQLFDNWLAQKKRDPIEPSTLSWYLDMVKPLRRHLGRVALSSVDRDLVRGYVSERRIEGARARTPSARTLASEVKVLGMTLSHATKRGWWGGDIKETCAKHDVGIPGDILWLYREELIRLFAVIREPVFYVAVALAAYCGLRFGEITHLQWQDWEVRERVLLIRAKPGWKPKGGYSRKVPLIDNALDALLKWRNRQVEPAPEQWILTSESGGRIRHNSWYNDRLRRACREAGIKEITAHPLRHTFATLAINANMSMFDVSRILGHRSIRTTEETYLHANSQHLVRESAKLQEHLRRA